MFLHLSVSQSFCSQGECLGYGPGGVCSRGWVSRPRPGGRGLPRGCPGPGPGVSAWGVSRSRPGGSRPGPRGVQVQAQGGVYPSMHWGRPPQQTATAVDGAHPTGMHSCLSMILDRNKVNDISCFNRQVVNTLVALFSIDSVISFSGNVRLCSNVAWFYAAINTLSDRPVADPEKNTEIKNVYSWFLKCIYRTGWVLACHWFCCMDIEGCSFTCFIDIFLQKNEVNC